MSLKCISCKAEISRDFKACPHCGEVITDFLREYLDKPIDGKYQILERLGAGGMGEVFKALHIHLNTIRVIKIMRPSIQDELDAHERFNREARLATKIHHANVAALHDFSILPDGTKYMVWEYINGKSLAAVVRDRGALSSRHASSIAVQVLHGLDAIHRAGIIHRDVSPDNIMLTRDDERHEQAKIIDLGIAKTGVPEPDADETRAGVFVGKWRYCSPEQIGMLAEGETIDGRADLYSFGIVMYEMLTGTPPFIADGPHQYMLQHASETPRPMQIAKPELSVAPQLEAIVFKALEKDRHKRFGSAREFAAELERVLPSLDDTMAFRRKKTIAAAPKTPPPSPRPGRPAETQKTGLTAPTEVPELADTEATEVAMRPAAAPEVAQRVVATEAPKGAKRAPSKKPLAIGAIAAVVILMVFGVVGGRMLSRKEARPQPPKSRAGAQMDAARNPAVVPPVQVPPAATTSDTAGTTTTAAVTETAPGTQPTPPATKPAPESKKAEAPKETQAAEKRAPTALPPELPKRAFFGRRDRRFADSPEYARGFIHGIIKNYEELQRGDAVHWSSVAPGVKLASQKIVFGKFTNLSALNDSAMLSKLNDALPAKVESQVASPLGTLRAQGAVIWAEADPKKPQGVAVEVVFRDEKGKVIAALRHLERQPTAALAAKKIAEAVSEFVRRN